MRLLATVLLALATLAWASDPADARSRTQQAQAQTRSAAPQSARASATRRAEVPQRQARRSTTASRQAAAATRNSRQVAVNRRGTRQVAARGTSRYAAASCGRGGRCAPRAVSWQSGLAPATNMQAQSCPVGTMATLARGHSDIVRCLPL